MPSVETMAPAVNFFSCSFFFLVPSGGTPGVTAVDSFWLHPVCVCTVCFVSYVVRYMKVLNSVLQTLLCPYHAVS